MALQTFTKRQWEWIVESERILAAERADGAIYLTAHWLADKPGHRVFDPDS